MKLFGGSASLALAREMGKILGVKDSPVDQHIFPDGERRIRIAERVVDEHVVLVQSAYPPVDTNYMELFFLIDAVKRSGAEFITAIVPYFGYQRQDHIFRDGEAVSLEVVVRLLENLGIEKLVSVDMHSSRIPSLFHIPVKHISALPLFADKIKELSISSLSSSGEGRGEVGTRQSSDKYFSDTVLVSPDTGGIARIKKLSQLLDDMPYIVLEKDRDLDTGEVTIGRIEEGSVKGKKRAIFVDDMISSGGTMILGADFLKTQGIEEIVIFCTHPIFSADAPKRLQKSSIAKVFVTDTVPVPKEKRFKKLEIISVAPLLAEAVKA